jgi:hypothetical protein
MTYSLISSIPLALSRLFNDGRPTNSFIMTMSSLTPSQCSLALMAQLYRFSIKHSLCFLACTVAKFALGFEDVCKMGKSIDFMGITYVVDVTVLGAYICSLHLAL